jgi:hypothetical protein
VLKLGLRLVARVGGLVLDVAFGPEEDFPEGYDSRMTAPCSPPPSERELIFVGEDADPDLVLDVLDELTDAGCWSPN